MTLDYKMRSWSIMVKKLDDWMCVGCGSSKFLESHHIVPISHDNTMKYDIDNGVTLCLICHSAIHGKCKPTENYLKVRYPRCYNLTEEESRKVRVDRDVEYLESIRKYNEEYYREHIEEIKKRNREWSKGYYRKNKEKIILSSSLWKKSNNVRAKQYMAHYYLLHKDHLNKKSVEYYELHKDEINEVARNDRIINTEKYKKIYGDRVNRNPEKLKAHDVKYKKGHRKLLSEKSREYNKLHSADIQKRRKAKMQYLFENDFEEYERLRERHNYLRRVNRAKTKMERGLSIYGT